MTSHGRHDSHDSEVLIVGAGPTGLTLAMLLARHGVTSRVLERRPGLITHPRAHYVNTRTMELFHVWGLHDAVLAEGYPQEHMGFERLEQLGAPSRAERREFSPAMVTSCAQDRIEQILYRAVSDHDIVDVQWATKFVTAHDRGGAGVTVDVIGAEGRSTLTSRFLVGCDGSGSAVRRDLGVVMRGDADLGTLINVYFEGRTTPEGVVPPLAGQSRHPDAAGTYISMDGDHRWCFHHQYDPTIESPDDYDVERCERLVRLGTGVPGDEPVHIRSIRPWRMTALVADTMRVGNVFLAGDAAHAFPPTGGFGMNSGIQDAHNLAWKLALVVRGIARDVLLDSFEAERQPIAYLNTAQSMRNRTMLHDGDSPDREFIESRASTSVYSAAARTTDDRELSRLRMLEHVAALGQDLGFAYLGSPIVVDDGRTRPDIQIAHYVPNAAPGARAPHFPVVVGGVERSILDLYEGRLTLLTATDDAWVDAANAVAASTGLQIQVLTVDELDVADDRDVFSLYGIGPSGAVLVRPDGHVAFRSERVGDDVVALLQSAVHTAIGERQ